MDEITAGLTTQGQVKRAAAFVEAMNRLRSDGHFTTTKGVGVGQDITIECDGEKRTAVVAWAKALDGGLTQIFFRWKGETPND